MKTVAIIGGGPAGLMAATNLINKNVSIHLYEATHHIGTKFLVAGKGGFNLTNSENEKTFSKNYLQNSSKFNLWLKEFSKDDLIDFLKEINIPTYTGSSGRVFPEKGITPSTVLNNWLNYLETNGVFFHKGHKLINIKQDKEYNLLFENETNTNAHAIIIACGGVSWPQTGSDGNWTKWIEKELTLSLNPLTPANCGLNIKWSSFFKKEFAYKPIKNIQLNFHDLSCHGELMISDYGIEGTPVYRMSSKIRPFLDTNQTVSIFIDLKPNLSLEEVTSKLANRKPKKTLSNHIKSSLKFQGIHYSILKEIEPNLNQLTVSEVAKLIKALPIKITSLRDIKEAISCAGGVKFNQLNNSLMLIKHPGIFFAGEMLDWEAPTGGFLLQGCFTTGFIAAKGALNFLKI